MHPLIECMSSTFTRYSTVDITMDLQCSGLQYGLPFQWKGETHGAPFFKKRLRKIISHSNMIAVLFTEYLEDYSKVLCGVFEKLFSLADILLIYQPPVMKVHWLNHVTSVVILIRMIFKYSYSPFGDPFFIFYSFVVLC